MSNATRGVLYVHSAPSAMCPHVEWAVAGVVGMPATLAWSPQPAEQGTYRCELSWQGPVGLAATLTSTLRSWDRLRFEVTEEATARSEGMRFSSTPSLGVFHAAIGLHGDIMVPEERLKAAMAKAELGAAALEEEVALLLGRPWDDELEAFRYAGDGAPVRWLHVG
ncbi:DUF3145 domain-containing protein [Mumia sp. zg.B53]|uniref:DUF3145 domain-containing protein n=1 Tax=unclassified Mumia TaxID=2621872 RepID=UPI001C6F0BC0|nr:MULTISPECIES: DUF3145 domain-containing protein [unclassified Mumia]MBW9206383.1 DUF3145 domain-containing protein [Mumia sp. zg.B17]MBW9211327.1 DUF3145 domain-containing protein [Mumia sp. zg.B21]MBW9215902.1 DUF3145 domain-containing protein [Mumia sp. zg.B53]MDD9348052.1 DUF3145 domain-containing protein [Mumia sp.]